MFIVLQHQWRFHAVLPLHLHFVAFVFRCVFIPRVAFCGVWVQSHFHMSRQYSFPQPPPFTYSKTEMCGLYSMISFSVVELLFRVRSLYLLYLLIWRKMCSFSPVLLRSWITLLDLCNCHIQSSQRQKWMWVHCLWNLVYNSSDIMLYSIV